MARRELHDVDQMYAEPVTRAELAELRSDINEALRTISAQIKERPNPSARSSSSGDSALMGQLFALQAEMRENARAENERLRAEIRELQVQEDPLDEIDRARRLVDLLPQEKDETKEMIMGALGMLAEVMTRDTTSEEEPGPAATPGHAGHVQGEHHGSAEPFDPEADTGVGREIVTDLGVVLVEE